MRRSIPETLRDQIVSTSDSIATVAGDGSGQLGKSFDSSNCDRILVYMKGFATTSSCAELKSDDITGLHLGNNVFGTLEVFEIVVTFVLHPLCGSYLFCYDDLVLSYELESSFSSLTVAFAFHCILPGDRISERLDICELGDSNSLLGPPMTNFCVHFLGPVRLEGEFVGNALGLASNSVKVVGFIFPTLFAFSGLSVFCVAIVALGTTRSVYKVLGIRFLGFKGALIYGRSISQPFVG